MLYTASQNPTDSSGFPTTPDAFDTTAVIRGLAVREIHADDVGAAANQVLEDARRVGRGTQRGDDLGAAKHGMWERIADIVRAGAAGRASL